MTPLAFTLRQLQYAVAVAEPGGFRRAAERCRVSQPSLSAQLAQLEGMDDLERAPVREDPFVLAGSPRHRLLAARGPLRARDLRDEPVLLLEDGHCFRAQALELCSGARAREAEYRATSLSTLAQMVAGGAGVTLLPSLSLPVENRRGELAVRRFEDPAPGRTIVLAWRRQSPFAEALRRLAATLARVRIGGLRGERR